MKVLVVILNKDNGDKLEKCLESLVCQTAKVCKDFDILILDGKSKDNSEEVGKKFEGKYRCIKFKVQDRLGGTGFARKEACIYALKKGYDVIIWGDSENEYEREYVEKILKKIREYDVVGGVPIVKGGFYAHAFAWYHALHLVFPNLYKKHIPGNNKAEKTEIFKEVMYPESKRAEDYGLSLLLMKRGIKLKQGIADAKVKVSVPETLSEVHNWQKARAIGAAEAAREVGVMPIDSIGWIFMILAPFFLILDLKLLLVYFILIFAFSIFLFVRSKKYIEKPRKLFFFAPIFGIFVHAAYTVLSICYYLFRKSI